MALAQHLDNLSDHAEVPLLRRAIDRSRIEKVGTLNRTPFRNHALDVPMSVAIGCGQKTTIDLSRFTGVPLQFEARVVLREFLLLQLDEH